jgi:cobalt/nickel transport system permease protein
MHHDFIDRYSRLDSPVHRAPAALKLGLALLGIVVLVTAPLAWVGVFVAVALWLALVLGMSRVPVRFFLGRLLLLEPLVAGMAVLSLLQPGGGRIALSIVVKSTLCLASMILLTNTTPFADLLSVLRRVGVPALLVTVLALLYRYLFVLIEEGGRMQRARASRTFRTPQRAQAWKTSAELAGQLFVRSTERAERIYAAMCARGWR